MNNDGKPLISIIVPCYNVELYVDRCLKSIERQTIGVDNLEIILINDASTDATLDRLKAWEQKYPEQILVITYEENLRQGGARNVGLQYARANYIGFVDSDDWIEPDMYESLYEKAQEVNCDIVRCKFSRETNEEQYKCSNAVQEDQLYNFPCKDGWYYASVGKTGNVGEYGGIWTGLYRKNLILENQVFFPEKIAYEDNYWWGILQLYVKQMYIIDRVLYHYFRNPNSTLNTENQLYHLERMEIEVRKVETYKRLGVFDLYKKEIEWQFIELFYLNTWFTIFTKFSYIPDVLGDMKKMILYYFPDYHNELNMQLLDEREKVLMKLLDIQGEVRPEELEGVKMAYIDSIKTQLTSRK